MARSRVSYNCNIGAYSCNVILQYWDWEWSKNEVKHPNPGEEQKSMSTGGFEHEMCLSCLVEEI